MPATHHPIPLLLLLLAFALPTSPSSVGINYGLVANNLPSPAAVLPLLHSLGVTKVKLYDSDPAVLRAFANTGIDFTIGIPDRCIPKLAKDSSEAVLWVKYNLLPYLPDTKISAITVGNEVLTGNDSSVFPCLLPALQAVRAALTSLNLNNIAVTTAHNLAILSVSYPPSSATFRKELLPYVAPLLSFLAQTGSPLLINAYPYFAYKAEPHRVALDYVLFNRNSGVIDPKTNLRYSNMLHAQVDAMNYAIVAVMGEEKAKCVVLKVSETGWPSKGDGDEAGATLDNARMYNGNLFQLVDQNKGTPMRPETPLDVYVFALFNENLKPGPTSERNYGLFNPDGSPVYQLGKSSSSSGGNAKSPSSSSGEIGGGGNGDSPADGSSSTGYYSISAAKKVESYTVLRNVVLMGWCLLWWMW